MDVSLNDVLFENVALGQQLLYVYYPNKHIDLSAL